MKKVKLTVISSLFAIAVIIMSFGITTSSSAAIWEVTATPDPSVTFISGFKLQFDTDDNIADIDDIVAGSFTGEVSGTDVYDTVVHIPGLIINGLKLESSWSNDWVFRGDHPPPADTINLHETYYTYEATSVPIPGAVWLLGSGLVGLVGMRRKFRK
jgi:hypothetical protein